VDKSYRANESS